MSTKLFKFLYKFHLVAGLFVALHLIVLSLSGSLLLFKDELTASSTTSAAKEKHNASVSPQKLLEQALEKFPGERPLAFSIDEEDPSSPIVQFRLGPEGSKDFRGARRAFFDRTTGAEVTASVPQSSFFDWLLRLHREFLLGSNGKIYVGLVGLLYVFVLISGFFIYSNFGRKKLFGEVRRQSARSAYSDMHRFLGMVVFAWSLIIGASGFFLGISTTLIKFYQYGELKKILAQYPTTTSPSLPPLDKVLANAKAALPDSNFSYLAFPDTLYSPPGHFLVLMNGNTPFTEKLSQLVIIDGTSGDLTEVRQVPWYLKFTMLSEPLHFGNYGGLVLKIIWLIFSLLSLALPVLGVAIFFIRKKRAANFQPPAHPSSVYLGKSAFYRSVYRGPTIMAFISIVGVVGAFMSSGLLNLLFCLTLLYPLFFSMRFFLLLWRKGGSHEK